MSIYILFAYILVILKYRTHEICKYYIQNPVKTLTYSGMNFDKSQGTIGIEIHMNSVHLYLTQLETMGARIVYAV